MNLATGKFGHLPTSRDLTVFETELGFMAIKLTTGINRMMAAVQQNICAQKKQLVKTWMSSIASGDRSYNLDSLFGKGHIAIRASAALYVSKCREVAVMIRHDNPNCTNEIPVLYQNSSYFVDPISFIIQPHATSVVCSDLAPPRWKIAGTWFCSHPQLIECLPADPIPLNHEGEVAVEELDVKDLHIGYSIYSKNQMQEFANFAHSAGARKAYLADQAHQSIAGLTDGGLSEFQLSGLMDKIGNKFIPLYRIFGRPTTVILMIMFCFALFKVICTVILRAIVVSRVRGCGLWVFFALWGTLFLLLLTPLRAANDALSAVVDETVGPKPKEKNHDAEPEDTVLRKRLYPDVQGITHETENADQAAPHVHIV